MEYSCYRMNDSEALLITADGGFTSAVTAEIPALYHYALTLVGDPVRAEWLVSDTLSRAWEKSDSFRQASGLKTWLHRILHNLAIDNARRTAREVSAAEVEDQWKDETFSVDPEKVVEMFENKEEIQDSLLRLPFAYRSALVLHDVEGWKLSEIMHNFQQRRLEAQLPYPSAFEAKDDAAGSWGAIFANAIFGRQSCKFSFLDLPRIDAARPDDQRSKCDLSPPIRMAEF